MEWGVVRGEASRTPNVEGASVNRGGFDAGSERRYNATVRPPGRAAKAHAGHTSVAQAPDNATVAPHVLTRLISTAVRAVPGVARLGVVPRGGGGLPGDHHAGVALHGDPDGVRVDCYLVARPDTNLLETALAVQFSVAAMLSELAGVAAREVNVYIQDVGDPSPAGETVAHA
ncbi:MAG TPA: Asp23/Gls24 family envelope stress response protein [Roseiflexaceae bacterium]|nr:Asp23/Gls24 family envelope stress response protein [Roseiflexaceae bacterium]